MGIPATREELKDYCLRSLGHPVITINIDDDQVSDRIDEAFQYYQQFHFDATERTYLKHQITANNITEKCITVPSNVIGVTRIFSLSSSNTTRNMFDIRYQMRLQDIQSLTSASFSYYVITQQHLSMIDMLLVGQVPIRFNRHTDKLYIDWDWRDGGFEGDWIIIEASTILDPEEYTKVFNDRMLKHYTTALIKKQWGNNMKKFQGVQLINGVQMNGQQIFEEAVTEIKEIEQQIRLEFESPPSMLIG